MKNALLVVGLLMIGSLAFAHRGDNNRPKDDRSYQQDRQEMMAERLEFTDEQQAKLEDLRMAHLKSTSTIRSELKIKMPNWMPPFQPAKPIKNGWISW